MSGTVLDRFDAKVDRSGECWLWTAATRNGYGVFHPAHGETVAAHRYALARELGRPIAPGLFACHECDNPACIRPSHLFEGTNSDNVADMVSKQRQARGSMKSELTEEAVVRMRELAADGAKLADLASRYGVSAALVTMIVRGQRWTHAGGPITTKYRKAA